MKAALLCATVGSAAAFSVGVPAQRAAPAAAAQLSMAEGASTRRAMLAGLLVGVPAAANAMVVRRGLPACARRAPRAAAGARAAARAATLPRRALRRSRG